MIRRIRALAVMVMILTTLAGCGVPATPGGSPSSQPPVPGFANLRTELLTGYETAHLVAPAQNVDAQIVRVAGAAPMNLGLQIVRNRQLREFAKNARGDFSLTSQIISSSATEFGILLTTVVNAPDGRQITATSVYFDAQTNQVYTSPALIDVAAWDAFVTEAKAATIAAHWAANPDKVAAALAEAPAPLGKGPAMGFSPEGDLLIVFRSRGIVDTDTPPLVKMPAATVAPWLSPLGQRVLDGVTHSAVFDGTAPRTAVAPTIPLVATGTRPSADVVPDCSKIKCVALTFDDGPWAGTQRVVKALTAAGVGATFFQLGNSIEADPADVLRVAASGLEVGSHTWRHQVMSSKTPADILIQVTKNNDAIQSITGDRTYMLRPPYGAHNKKVDAVLADFGVVNVMWTIDTQDWKTLNTAADQASASAAKPGDIVLMHDVHDPTIAAVPDIIKNLVAGGFTLLPSSELASPGAWVMGKNYCAAPYRNASCW